MLQKEPKVTFRHLHDAPLIREMIKRKTHRLEKFFPRITSCETIIEGPSKHHRHGTPYRVVINVGLPGKQFVVSNDSKGINEHSNVYSAITDSFNVAARRLQNISEAMHSRSFDKVG